MGQNLTNIIITQPNGNRVPMTNRRTVTGVVQARQNWALNGIDTVDITVVSGIPQQYNIGDQITIFGRDYKLNRMPSVKKNGEREYEYSLQFEGVQYDLFRVTYDVNIDTTTNQLQDIQGDSLTGNLRRFLDVLIANANRVFPGRWKAGECPVTIADKTLTFGESDNCLSVLQNLCNEDNFNVEFDIQQIGGVYTINLYERVGKVLPLTFEYGKGHGLMNIVRENVSLSNIVTRLKVFGSSENITSKYRASRLCLPGKTKGQSYIEKPEMVAKYGIFEGRKDFNDIKPTFTGKIETKDGDYAFIDSKFPFDLNAKDANGTLYLMAGTPAKIHFNTGNLAGYEFDVTSYDHTTHRFTIRKITDERGNEFPSKQSLAFQFSVGDEYKVLDIAYSPEIELKAEQELLDAANRYYDHNCQPKVQYGVTVTPAYLKQLVGTVNAVVNIFAPGDFLHIIDKEIGVDKSIRIKSFVRDVLSPYSYSLTIADDVADVSITNRVVSDLNAIDKIVQMNNLNDPARARANWRSSREVLDMVFDTEGDYYTDKIKPNSIDTAALAVGAKSMQFGLTNTIFQPNYNGNPNIVKWVGGILTHYTIKDGAAVVWTMADGEVVMTDNSAVYVYAKCEKIGNVGVFIFTAEQIRVNDDANYYHFLVGTLSSVDTLNKARSLALTYGFSTVNGRFIKTGRIESADGKTFFDLDNSEIGGKIAFRRPDGTLKTVDELGYDNTQTTIDGGIVTSGTIEVAGDKSNILAGMTGIGVTPDSVRFWAGVPFASRANAPFCVEQSGKMIATNAVITGEINANSGVFQNVMIKGSYRSPFVAASDSFDTDYSDNIAMISQGGGWVHLYSLPWDSNQSGRIIRIVNYKWGTQISEGVSAISAPTGLYFFENGIRSSELKLSRECLELLGYGSHNQFYGWIVLRRINLMTNNRYGREIKCLLIGSVTVSGNSAVFKKVACYDGTSGNSQTSLAIKDGTVSLRYGGIGCCYLTIPSSWFSRMNDMMIQATGSGWVVGSTTSPCKATATPVSASEIRFDISDDDTSNDGSFMFVISNMNDWMY